METQWVKPQQSVCICTGLREEEEYCFVFFCQQIIKLDLFAKYLENKILYEHKVCNRQPAQCMDQRCFLRSKCKAAVCIHSSLSHTQST